MDARGGDSGALSQTAVGTREPFVPCACQNQAMTRLRAISALLASVGLHAVPLSAGLAWQALPRVPLIQPPPLEEDDAPAAVWAGDTFDVDTLPSDVSVAATQPSPESPPPRPPATRSAAIEESTSVPPPAAARESTAPSESTAAARAPAADSQPTAQSEAAAPGAGSYGAAGAAAVSAPLGKGLLRVLPRAAFVDPIFHELPWGTSAKVRFAVELDDEGRAVLPLHFDEDQTKVPWLETLLGRAVLLLRGGAFSLPPGVSGPARSSFELELQVVRGAAASGDWAEPRDLAEIGRLVEPTRTQPGRAHFRYNSGREVQLLLRLR